MVVAKVVVDYVRQFFVFKISVRRLIVGSVDGSRLKGGQPLVGKAKYREKQMHPLKTSNFSKFSKFLIPNHLDFIVEFYFYSIDSIQHNCFKNFFIS